MAPVDEVTNTPTVKEQGDRLERILERVGRAEDGELLLAIEYVLDRHLEGRDLRR